MKQVKVQRQIPRLGREEIVFTAQRIIFVQLSTLVSGLSEDDLFWQGPSLIVEKPLRFTKSAWIKQTNKNFETDINSNDCRGEDRARF